ncbi:MAG: hypothetical protein IPL65_05375 [Lewinellaceae bacterium]|nr:hypothetical protein [Lewinellaceae bacterium]
MAVSEQAERNFGNCPPCSCDSITTIVQQELGTSDTSNYYLSFMNSGEYCFPYLEMTVDTGQLLNYTALLPGWDVMVLTPNSIRLIPPNNYLPTGAFLAMSFHVFGTGAHNVTVRTGSDDLGCPKAFHFPSPPAGSPNPMCCPNGTVPGPELVQNGDFSANTLPASDYLPTNPWLISIKNQNQVYNTTWLCLGKTGPFDNFFVVDGVTAPGKAAWKQQVSVNPNADYVFCAMFNNMFKTTLVNTNPVKPIIHIWIEDNGGNTVASNVPYTLPENPDVWVNLSLNWTTPSTLQGPYTLKIATNSLAGYGNDFAIDCISFRECGLPQPCSVSISANPTPYCNTGGTLTAIPTGPGPYSYQWCTAENTQSIQWENMPCGATCGVTLTCADGAEATASFTATDNVPPTAVCVPGFGVTLDANCSYTVTPQQIDGGSSDNCQIQSMSVSPTLLTGCGDFPITLTVTDWCGNTSTCTTGIQTIEVDPPLMTCPANTTVTGVIGPDGNCTAVYQAIPPVAFDNCSSFVSLSNNAPAALQFGPNSVIWTAMDDCGNTATCSVVITVECDTMPSGDGCCAYALQFVNLYHDDHIKKIKVYGICETQICCADPDDWQQNADFPNSVEWFREDTLSVPFGDAIDNDFLIFLDKAVTPHNLQVEWLDGAGTVLCRHTIEISCDGPFSEDEDWTVYTSTTTLDDPNLFVFAVREDSEDDEGPCDELENEISCEASYDVVCSGGNSYIINLHGPSGFNQFFWQVQIGPSLPAISSVQNPSFQLTQSGSYVISLFVVNSLTKDTCQSDLEIIIPDIVPDFEYDMQACGTTVDFAASGWDDISDISNISWTCVGVPTFPTSGTFFSHTFPGSGATTATMVIQDKYGCSHPVTKSLIIDASIHAGLEVEKYTFCGSECDGVTETYIEVQFKNKTKGGACPITYNWDYGDGQTLTTTDPQAGIFHMYKINCPPNAQTFQVNLAVQDFNLYTSSASTSVQITPCQPDFSYVICPDGRVDFTSTVDGEWFFPGHIAIAPWPYSEKKDKYGRRKKVSVRYGNGLHGVTFIGHCANGGECTINKEIDVILDCCTKNMLQKDTALFSYNGFDYKMKSRFRQSQKPAVHKIKASTKLKKRKSSKGHLFWKGAGAETIVASFWGSIYSRDANKTCNCVEEEQIPALGNPTPTDSQPNSKKAKVEKTWYQRKFHSRKDSLTSGHSVQFGTSLFLVNLKLGKDCNAFHWWTDWY